MSEITQFTLRIPTESKVELQKIVDERGGKTSMNGVTLEAIDDFIKKNSNTSDDLPTAEEAKQILDSRMGNLINEYRAIAVKQINRMLKAGQKSVLISFYNPYDDPCDQSLKASERKSISSAIQQELEKNKYKTYAFPKDISLKYDQEIRFPVDFNGDPDTDCFQYDILVSLDGIVINAVKEFVTNSDNTTNNDDVPF